MCRDRVGGKMSLGRMRREVDLAGLSESQREWWPRHLKAFGEASQQRPAVEMTVKEDAVIQFLRSCRDAGFPAGSGLRSFGRFSFISSGFFERQNQVLIAFG